jgi:hypothetical protein
MIEKKENKYRGIKGTSLDTKTQAQDQTQTQVVNLKKEIEDLRKIIDLLNTNIQLLETNTASALGHVQAGGGFSQSSQSSQLTQSTKLNKLLVRAIKLSNSMQIAKNNKCLKKNNF